MHRRTFFSFLAAPLLAPLAVSFLPRPWAWFRTNPNLQVFDNLSDPSHYWKPKQFSTGFTVMGESSIKPLIQDHIRFNREISERQKWLWDALNRQYIESSPLKSKRDS